MAIETECDPAELGFDVGRLGRIDAHLVDPVEQLTAMFFTQVFPLRPLALRGTLRQLVYQALIDDGPPSRPLWRVP